MDLERKLAETEDPKEILEIARMFSERGMLERAEAAALKACNFDSSGSSLISVTSSPH